MVDTYNYADYYGSDPWGAITLNERKWYDPVLRNIYQRASVYSQHVKFKVDLAPSGMRASRTITFNETIAPRPNINPISNRQMESSRLFTDSAQREVRTIRYGNGMSLHRESEMFSYWQLGGGGDGHSLLPLINHSLGQALTDHLDILARNAHFLHPYAIFGTAATGTSVSTLTNSDKMNTALLDSIWLNMRDTSMPFQPISQPFAFSDEVLCITTPGAVHDLKNEVGTGTGGLNFVDINKYTEAGRTQLYTGELGWYRGTRFVQSPMAKLHNIGTITAQTSIKAAVVPGQGAPDPATTKVDGVRMVGQPGTDAKHYIDVLDASIFSVGDIVTVHLLRHDSGTLAETKYANKGVTNGVIYDDAMAQNMQIYAIDTASAPDRLVFTEPYMMTQGNGKGLETDLGSTVFGYVTKGRNVHTSTFLNSAQAGIVCGVSQSPVFYTPIPNDDFMSMYRISYDFWAQYQLWEPSAYNMVFHVGANSNRGKITY